MNSERTGHLHPITHIIRDIYPLFQEMGFSIADGPELEDEYHNFDALNIAKDHPARDMQDTFWIKQATKASGDSVENMKRYVLRTHTSSVQIRYMETHSAPIRIIAPGKVFRNEATDATHEAQFFQIESLYVDKHVSLAHLKGMLEALFKRVFGDDVEIRFVPSFFAFTEPSVEVHMRWKGRWLEIGGAGLVNPAVLRAAGINPEEWQGCAFGFGLDRIAMLKFGIDDVRHLYTGDLRLISQF